jgi:hypothetical protein
MSERRTTIMSERGEQQSCLREENNNLSDMIVVILCQK